MVVHVAVMVGLYGIISGVALFLWHAIFEALFVDILDCLKRVSQSFITSENYWIYQNMSISPSLSPFLSFFLPPSLPPLLPQGSEQKPGALEVVSLSRLLFVYLYQLQTAGIDSATGADGTTESETSPAQDVLSIPA